MQTTWHRRRRRTLQAALLCTILLVFLLAVGARTHTQPHPPDESARGSQNVSHTPVQKHQNQILNATTTDRSASTPSPSKDHDRYAGHHSKANDSRHRKLDLKRVHPSVKVAAEIFNFVDRRHAVVSNLADTDESSSPLWYTIRWIPFAMLAIGLGALGWMWYRGICDPCCCLREKIVKEDERVAAMNPEQPLRASLLAQSSFAETLPSSSGVNGSRWPHNIQAGNTHVVGFTGSNGSSPITPESPYSPMHTHPYAWRTKSYQNPSLALHPPDDLVTPQQVSRTLVKQIEAQKR
jgi:hypothetical protein